MRLTSLLCLWFAPSTLAVGSFINPSGQDGTNRFHPMQVVKVQWLGTADYSLLSLGYFSQHNTTVTWLILNSPNYPTRYSWTVTPGRDGFDITQDDEFYMWVVNGTDFESPFYSPMFYLRRETDTSSMGPTSVQHPTLSSYLPSATPTPTESESGETSGDGGGGGLSTAAKAGIGVGAAVGGLLIIGVIIFFVLRRRKANRITDNNTPQASPPEDKKDDYHSPSTSRKHPYMDPIEAPANVPDRDRQELDGTVRAELEGDSHR